MVDSTGDDLTTAFGAYLPEDRLAELRGGPAVPHYGQGSVLFADVVGFTGLTTRLAELLGPRRGAEEVPVYLNRLYEVLIGEVGARGGSVIGFAGDAITCWFPGDDGSVAAACGSAMQAGMSQFAAMTLPGAGSSQTFSLRLKVVVTAGRVRRFATGDPAIQLLDVIAGEPLAQIEALEGRVSPGEVLVSDDVERAMGATAPAGMKPSGSGVRAHGASLSEWLLPTVQQRLAAGGGDFLTELRPVAALFLSFGGIDLAEDDAAHVKFGEVVRHAQRIATEYGGNVLQVTCGDKGSYLYMAFGAPVSHEDDVQRCAAAAVELRNALADFDFLTHVAIGLGHGTARTGAYGSASRRTYGALGEGTNMAARMMSAAPHGGVYMSGAFADALGSGFELRELEGVRIKGRERPVRAFRLVGLARDDSAPGPRTHGPLLERERELELLRAGIESAAGGRGRVIQLVAEAGMGKSELLRHALAQARGLRVVRATCQAFGRTAPYHPWKSVYQQLLGLTEAGSMAERAAQVRSALAAIDAALAEQAELLSPLLGLPAGAATGMQDAEERSAARRVLLLTIFRHAARRTSEQGRTLALVLEDLHWLDPASAELLVAVCRAVRALRVVLITTTRPSDAAAEALPVNLEGADTVRLAPLDAPATARLVADRLTASTLLAEHGKELVEPIVERSGGNPFYAHELVTYVLQRAGTAAGEPEAAGAGPLAWLLEELPTSLHSLILGRLDRLEHEQQLDLKVASVVGREFRTAWVSACQGNRAEERAELSFEATARAGLTQRIEHEAAAHEFNHAITRDAVYHSLPHANQARLHTALARFVETRVATTTEPQLDLLAFHYALGEDPAKARHYLGAAGAAAKAAYANRAALDYFGRLLELQSGHERLPTLLELGEVSSFVGAYAAAEGQLLEALALARAAEDRLREATALRLLGELHERQGDHKGARGHLETAAALCRQHGDEGELTRVLLALGGNVLWQLGEYDTAAAQLQEAVDLARAIGDARAAARALHGTANIHLYMGNWAAAEAAFAESLAIRRAAKDDHGVANALNNLAIVYANAGHAGRAEELFRESLGIRQRLGDASGVAVALNNLGYMAAERGDLPGARELYEESLAARRVLGDRLGLAVSLNSLGTLLLRSHEENRARELFLESAALAAAIDNRREAAAALAGLANATPEGRTAARLAGAAELLLAQLGAAVDAEVQEHLERVSSRSGTAEPPAQLRAAPLAAVVDWALYSSEPFSE